MNKQKSNWADRSRLTVAGLLLALSTSIPAAELLTLSVRDGKLNEVMEMLSRQHRVSILLADDVDAQVSFSLYDVTLDDAIESIANAAGYFVEVRRGTYFVMSESGAGKIAGSGFTVVKSLPVRYVDVTELESKLNDYLSDFGSITAVPERKTLVIEDQPIYVNRISRLLTELDKQPPQVMIEAKIYEIKLNDEQSFGIDWTALFQDGNGAGDIGINGLLTPGNSGNQGFVFNFADPNLEAALRALEADGRVRNLASPKVVTVVNEEAEVIIGDRRGYRVTTTINQVTTESIEFLESGTILRVTPTIDDSGKILLDIHPEVSTGSVDEQGVPSQTTTEVTTRLLVNSGQSIFIGGLMRNTTTEGRAGVPVLGRIPILGWAFSSKTRTSQNTETIVIITPRVIDNEIEIITAEAEAQFDEMRAEMNGRAEIIDAGVSNAFLKPPEADGAEAVVLPQAEADLTQSDEAVEEPESETAENKPMVAL